MRRSSSSTADMGAADMTQAGDLATVVPPERTIRIGDAEYRLRPVCLGQLPRVLAAIKPVAEALAALGPLDPTDPDRVGALLLAVLLEHPQVLLDALVATSDLPASVIEGADLAVGVELLEAVIELNADFFARAVAPRLAGVLGAAATAMPAS